MRPGRECRSKLTAARTAQGEGFGNVCRAAWDTALDLASTASVARG